MNILSLIKWAAVGLFAGFLASPGLNLGNDLLALTGLMVFIVTVLVLYQLANLEPATSVAVEPASAA